MAVGDRIGRAEGRVGPRLCAGDAPCQTVTTTELRLLPDGSEESSGTPPPPLCEACPERGSRRVLHVEVFLDCRNRHGGEVATSGATLPAARLDGDEGEHDTSASTVAPTEPEDGLPAAWGPDHPARLAAKGQEPPQRPRGRGNDGTIFIDPRDFGL